MGLSSKLASYDDVAALDWTQEIIELIPVPTNQARNSYGEQQQQRPHWPPLKCPRCKSTNTKFCYYNNYSRTQPRHFCKACKRHWTEGGTLRNVPVGGGRKSKRSKPTTSASTSTVSSDAAAAAAAAAAAGSSTATAAAKGNSIGSAPLPLPLPSKFPLFFNGDNSSNVFPETLHRILLRPPPQPAFPPPLPQLQLATADYSFVSSFQADPSQAPPVSSREDDDNSSSNPLFSMISSSYAYALPSATEDAVSACSAAAGARQVGQATALPSTKGGIDHSAADFWSGWDDDMGGA